MHVFATNTDKRHRAHLALAAVSLVSAWSLSQALQVADVAVAWWIDSPSVLGFYGLYYQWFENSIWHAPLARHLGLSDVPDLRGRWVGHLTSSLDDHAMQYDAALEIQQSWSRISITMRTTNSSSRSQTAAIDVVDEGAATLTYQYISEPSNSALPTMQMHRGTGHLDYKASGDEYELVGSFYTGRGRQTVGLLRFTRAI